MMEIWTLRLKYLREQSLGLPSHKTNSEKQKRPFSKKKFGVLLATNLMLWMYVTCSYLEASPVSIKESMLGCFTQRGLVVNGVVYNSKIQAAIICNEIYQVGDNVKGYTIVDINKEGVGFEKGDESIFKKVN